MYKTNITGAKVAQAVAGRKVHDGLAVFVVYPASLTPLILPPDICATSESTPTTTQKVPSLSRRNVFMSKQLPSWVMQLVINDMLKGNRCAKVVWPRHAMGDNILELVKNIHIPVLIRIFPFLTVASKFPNLVGHARCIQCALSLL